MDPLRPITHQSAFQAALQIVLKGAGRHLGRRRGYLRVGARGGTGPRLRRHWWIGSARSLS